MRKILLFVKHAQTKALESEQAYMKEEEGKR
jgi:hypothetical protein